MREGLEFVESGEGQSSLRQTLTQAFAGSHPVKSSGREEKCVLVFSYDRRWGGKTSAEGLKQHGDKTAIVGKLTSLQTSMVPKMT